MIRLREIIKTDSIIRISPGDHLSSALSKLTTSHDSGFVFTDDNKYLGVVNPYYCLIKSSYPGNAKVEHCVFHAPRIYVNYPVHKIAQLLIESKVHYLPVFDEFDRFLGIISARRLLAQLLDSPVYRVQISELIKNKKQQSLITVLEDDSVATALHKFRESKISKLVVTDRFMRLKGILSYYDLISHLVTPKESTQRNDFNHLKVKHLAKVYVLTLTPKHLVSEALKLILDKKIGSVVIINSQRQPIGIVTTKDLLQMLMRAESGKNVEIISKNLSQKSRQALGGFFYSFSRWIKKIPDLAKARLFIKEEKEGGLFEAVLSLFPKKGSPKVIKQEGKNLVRVLRKIKKN